MAAAGWVSASTHVHGNYGGNLHNSLENLVMMSEAEDQDIVLHQVANKDNRILDYQWFEPGGGAHSASTPEHPGGRGPGVPGRPSTATSSCFGMRDHLSLAVHDGLRGHRHREPLPQQHRHVPQGEGAGGHRRLRARVRRRERPPRRQPRRRARGSSSTPPSGPPTRWSGRTRPAPASSPLYAVWSNGLRITATGARTPSATCTARTLVGSVRHLRPHRGPRPRRRRVAGGAAGGAGVRPRRGRFSS